MSQELFFTSAPKGLRPGSKGFCTVAATVGMSPPLAERLELLSGYRPLFPLGDPRSADNPVLWAHWRISIGGKTSGVLSRVSFAGADYTQRSNKFAHHLVLDSSEQVPGGPAWLMLQPGVMDTNWNSEPRIISTGRQIPFGDIPPKPCEAWAAITGDAGWGGVLAESFMSNPSRPSYVIFEPGTDLLPLINESLSLLPPNMRWQVTFCTYFTDLPSGLTCHWRCCAAGTTAAKEAMRLTTEQQIIDLTKELGSPKNSNFVSSAAGSTRSMSASAIGATIAADTDPSVGATSTLEATDALSRRRVLGVTARDANDQGWMPPLGATLVEEPESSDYQRKSILPWVLVVSLLLTSVALATGWIIATRKPRPPVQSDLEAKLRKVTDERNSFEKLAGTIEEEKKLAFARGRDNPLPEKFVAKTAYDELRKKNEKLEADFKTAAEASKQSQQAPSGVQKPNPAPPAREPMQPGKVLPEVPAILSYVHVAAFPTSSGSLKAMLLSDRLTDERLELVLPSGVNNELSVEKIPEGLSIIRTKIDRYKNNATDRAELVRIQRTEQGVAWEWQKEAIVTAKQKEWDEALSYSVIKVFKADVLTTQIQFQKYENLLLKTAEPKANLNLPVSKYVGSHLRLLLGPTAPSAPWVTDVADPTKIVCRFGDASFTVRPDSAWKTVSLDLNETLNDWKERLNHAQKEYDAADKAIIDLNKDLDELQKHPKKNQQAIEDKQKAVQEHEKQRAAVNDDVRDAQKVLDACDTLRPFDVCQFLLQSASLKTGWANVLGANRQSANVNIGMSLITARPR